MVNLLAAMALGLGAISQTLFVLFVAAEHTVTYTLWMCLFWLGYTVVLILNFHSFYALAQLTLLLVFFGSIFVQGSLFFGTESLMHVKLLVVVPAVTLIYERRRRNVRWGIIFATALLFLYMQYSPSHPRVILDAEELRTLVTANVALCAIAVGVVAFLFSVDTQQLLSTLEYRANYDPLTGLLNRRAFFRMQDSVRRASSKGMGLLWMDIDGFKQVNDTHGHDTGDRVLQFVVRQIKAHLREDSLFVRMGGDELVILLAEVTEPEARRIAERVCDAVAAQPYREEGITLPLSVSIGGVWSWGPAQLAEMTNAADEAMYRAKRLGKNRVEWHVG